MNNAAIKINFENFVAFDLINFLSERISRMKNATADYKYKIQFISIAQIKKTIYASITSVLLK